MYKNTFAYVHSNSFYYIKKEQGRGILMLADFDPIDYDRLWEITRQINLG